MAIETYQQFLNEVYYLLKEEGFWIAETFKVPSTHENKEERYLADGCTFYVQWSLGGTSGSYTGSTYQVSPEPDPGDVKELDLILAKVAPNMPFIKYKVLTSKILRTGQKHHGDYYGGSTTEAYRGFHIRELYEELVKMELLE